MAYSTVWLSANVTGAPLAAYVALVLATHCVQNPTFTLENVAKIRARFAARGALVTLADSHTVQYAKN